MTSASPNKPARLAVIKVGTALLTSGTNRLDRGYMHDLAAQLLAAEAEGWRLMMVSSGAVGCGLASLSFIARPTDLSALQAAAATGQPLLMDTWRDAFGVRDRHVAQLLVSRSDFDARDRFLNIRNCILFLLDHRIVPVINENDSVATEEISLGDNDVLAAKLAVSVRADLLVILTTARGVENEAGAIVESVDDPNQLAQFIRSDKTNQGRGGMATKVEAARLASRSGITTVIAPGKPADHIRRILSGERIGTRISADRRYVGRRHWIALSATPVGTIDVDEGAARAVCERGASLLAKGVRGVTGRFDSGDVVLIRDHHGKEIARGLTNLTDQEIRSVMGKASSEFERVLGRQTHEEVVHRDNLAITAESRTQH